MRIGDVTVHHLGDGVLPMPPGVLYPDVADVRLAGHPRHRRRARAAAGPVRGLPGHRRARQPRRLRPGRRARSATVPGGEPPEIRELLPGRLAELGCPSTSVTRTWLLSHLHIDHGRLGQHGGAFPRFPRPGHHIHAADWEHFVDGDADGAVRAKVGPLREAAVLWEGESVAPFDWLRLVHAPGHTPGALLR